MHKFVCGPGKADPFVWPDLTKEEVKDLEGHLDSPFYDRERKETTTCRKLLSRFPASVHPIELSVRRLCLFSWPPFPLHFLLLLGTYSHSPRRTLSSRAPKE